VAGSTSKASAKTCFISAPAGAKLEVLRAALETRGLRVLVPHELAVGTDWASEIQKQISNADLVIGVITSERQSPWVLFELGQASALGRRIVLITSPKTHPVPFSLHQFLVLRIDLDNQEAIGFALDQVLSAPDPVKGERAKQGKALAGLGQRADALIATLDRSLAESDWRSVEQVVAEALRNSGADVVVTSPSRDIGADLAVWSDVLEPFVGNPLLVEIKARIRTKNEATQAVRELASYVGASGSRWALLLFGEGPDPEGTAWANSPPNVLVLSLRSLLQTLRTRPFPEIVRDLRNRRVHGSSS
jgi:lambda repressor-like predicted transcriptional regulator